jgi:hypothetical protein
MAVKMKTKKKQTKSKRTPSNKMTSRKKTAKRKLTRKRETPKKLAKKAAQKKATVKTTAGAKKTIGVKTTAHKKQVRKKSQSVDTVAFPPEGSGARSGRQSGDLQGLSNVQGADSESVDELLEEGNPFEADVVTGVEDAGDADEREVRTHEVPQDDVPEEYLDKK